MPLLLSGPIATMTVPCTQRAWSPACSIKRQHEDDDEVLATGCLVCISPILRDCTLWAAPAQVVRAAVRSCKDFLTVCVAAQQAAWPCHTTRPGKVENCIGKS